MIQANTMNEKTTISFSIFNSDTYFPLLLDTDEEGSPETSRNQEPGAANQEANTTSETSPRAAQGKTENLTALAEAALTVPGIVLEGQHTTGPKVSTDTVLPSKGTHLSRKYQTKVTNMLCTKHLIRKLSLTWILQNNPKVHNVTKCCIHLPAH